MANTFGLDSYVSSGAAVQKEKPYQPSLYIPQTIDAINTVTADGSPSERIRLFRVRSNRLFFAALVFAGAIFFISEGDAIAAFIALAVVYLPGLFWLICRDDRHSPAGIDSQKNQIIYSLSTYNMQSAERLRMAEIDIQRRQLNVEALRVSALHVQSSAIESQSADGLSIRLAAWLLALYDGDRLDDDGRIAVSVLWSARGGLSPSDRKEALQTIEDWGVASGSWLVCQRRHAWYLNVDRFPSKEALAGVCGGV